VTSEFEYKLRPIAIVSVTGLKAWGEIKRGSNRIGKKYVAREV